MEGVCSECGLDFVWGDVLNRSRFTLPWLYEHRRGIPFFRAIGTMLRALQPWKFWSEVGLHHRPVPRRLIMYPLMLPLFFLFVSVSLAIVRFYLDMLPYMRMHGFWHPWLPDRLVSVAIAQFGLKFDAYSGFTPRHFNARPIYAIGGMIGFSAGMSLVILIAKSSRMISKMRAVHVCRAVSYGMTLGMLLYAAHASLWVWDEMDTGYGSSTQYAYTVLGQSPLSRVVHSWLWGVLLNGWLISGGSLVWMAVWWRYAIRDGFRLAEWRQVYLAGLCMGLVLACFSLASSGAWRWMYH